MNKEDKELKNLEKRLAREYQQAYSDISKKCDAYFKKFEKQDKEMKEKLPHDEYVKWRQNKMLTGKRWTALRDSLAKDYTNVNQIAARMIREDNIGVMTDAFNHGTYEVEKISGIDTNFTIYNRDSVENIIKNEPDLLPVNLDIPKNLRWNKSKVNSAIVQGILQGKPIKEVAKQLESVTDMNKNSAIRNARTMNTYARNTGRLKSYERADKLGVKTRKMWIATLDGRTRHSHRMLDREIVELDEAFSNGLMEPGDPDGTGGEIYNCRCRMIGVPDGINPNIFTDSRVSAYLDDNGVSYEEWKKAREPKEKKEKRITKPEIPENVRKEIDKFEEKFWNANKENYMAIDKDGNVIFESSGKERKVTVPKYVDEKMESGYSIHNHPADATFSSADISNYEKYGENGIITDINGYESILYNTNPVAIFREVDKAETDEEYERLMPFSSAAHKAFTEIDNDITDRRREYSKELMQMEPDSVKRAKMLNEWMNKNNPEIRKRKWISENAEKYGFIFERRKMGD